MYEKKRNCTNFRKIYFKPNGTRFFSIYGEICEVDNSFLQQLMNCKEILWFDAPDGFLKIGEKGIMCEHFTIDVSKTTKNKGSFIKRETQGNSKNFNLINFVKNINNENDIREKADKLAHINHLKNNFRMIYILIILKKLKIMKKIY